MAFKLCDNNLCKYHITILHGNQDYSIVHEGDKRIRIDRFLYGNVAGKRFHFCNTCHNAILMTSGRT